MPKDLAALLLEDGAVSAQALARAQARQRDAGGALDTALLEEGAVSEDVLSEHLARASELPAAPASAWSAADARARRVFPSRVAERHGLAPFALDGRELSLVATYPVDVGLLDEISFMLSLHLTAHVGPEWRVRELIHRLYGTPLPSRLAALAAAAGATRAALSPEPSVPPERAPPAPPSAAGPSGFAHDASEPLEPLAAALQQALDAVDPSLFEDDAGGEPASEPEAGEPPDRTAPPHWSLADARAAVAAARHRDEVVLAAVRYARDFFEFAAMFAVTRDAVAGHDALGLEDARDRARSVAIYAADPGIFRTVIETKSPYLGPVSRDAAGNEAILDGLGRGSPRTVLVHPVLLRDRAVCILYADNGEAPVSPRRLGDLLLLLSAVGPAFERIIRERKDRRRGAAGGPVAPAPSAALAGERSAARPRAPEPVLPEPPPQPEAPAGPVPAAGSFGEGPATGEVPVAEDLASELASPAAPAEGGAPAQDAPEEDPGEAWTAEAAAPEPAPAAPEAATPRADGGELADSFDALEDRFFLPDDAAAGEARAPAQDLPPSPTPPAAGPRDGAADPAPPPEPVPPLVLVERALEPDPEAGAAACAALAEQRRDGGMRQANEKLRRVLLSGLSGRAARAARALAATRDVEAIPLLIQVLEMSDAETAAAAGEALAGITLQRLGVDARRWLGWWKQNRGRGRAEWLFSGLTSPDRETRRAAATELALAAPPPVAYSADAPPAERERAARAWAGWWARNGHVL